MTDKVKIAEFVGKTNLCEFIAEETLVKMGMEIIDWVDDDELARQAWRDQTDQWLKLATQVVERKSYPWPNAANVKFPLIATAALQFAARAYPALVPGPNLVQGLVIGKDEGGTKQQSADRVGKHMSYQLMFDMDDWEEEMDKLCTVLPILGCIFKKTFYDEMEEKNVSELIYPQDLIIDYYAKSIESAHRKSHVIWKNANEVEERIRNKIFSDVDLSEPVTGTEKNQTKNEINGTQEPKLSPATPHKFIECHTFWDLDNDGYAEPYIITVHYESKKVVRVKTRFDVKDIKEDDKGNITRIKPREVFTKFPFIPNPDGGIYDVGFGLLLGGINASVNTLTNLLLDAGTINNLQAGFLGRGIRTRSGSMVFSPGEWKPVDFTGDDIKKHIFPLPTKEPSETLFKLLEALVTSGKELASVAEIMVGKMPGQNTPATTTMATIEQGLKVFTAIYKRIYRALNKEYQKLFKLNEIHLDQTVFFTINEPQGPNNQQVSPEDYSSKNLTVKPFADPNVVSSAQKLMRVQSYGALLQLQTINPQEYTKRFLEAVDAENISALMKVTPQPSPEEKQAQMEMQQSQQEHQSNMQAKQVDGMIKQQDAQMKAQVEAMKAMFEKQSMEMEMRFKAFELHLKEREAQLKLAVSVKTTQQDLALGQQEHEQAVEQSSQQHEQKMTQQKAQHEQKLKQAKEKPNATGANNKG